MGEGPATLSCATRRNMTLFLLLSILIGNSCFCYAEADSTASLTAGLDGISSTISEYENNCSQAFISEKLEEETARYEKIIEAQWAMFENVRESVENVTKRTQDLVDHHYETSLTEAPDACATPFKRVSGSCFWLHKSPALGWEKARERCQQEGADLATPDDLQVAMDFLNGEHGRARMYFWLGAKMSSREQWHWMDSDVNMDTDRKYWHKTSNNGDCVVFNGLQGYKLMNWDCTQILWFLCEKKIQ